MATSLVLGVNGQDGSFLAEILSAERGATVIGVDIQETPGRYAPIENYQYRRLDITESDSLTALLRETRPDRIYHFSAIHGSAGFAYEPVWRRALEVNVASMHTILEYAARAGTPPKIAYASSAKVFGDPLSGGIDEDSPKSMSCLYSVTKMAAEGLIRHYRGKFGVAAGVLHYFNHESARRPESFLFQKLARELAGCVKDVGHKFEMDNLSFYCDWGSAREYMELTVEAMEKAPGEDFIIATGKTRLGRDFVGDLWRRFGLDVTRHVSLKRSDLAPPPFFQASNQKMRRLVGKVPEVDALDICADMASSILSENTRDADYGGGRS